MKTPLRRKTERDENMLNQEVILQQAQTHDSFYLYDETRILENTRQLKEEFPGVQFLYSVKANPYPAVLRCVLNQGFGVDAASLAEVRMGQKAGLGKAEILYSAPAKTDRDLQEAIGVSTVIADSVGEVDRLQDVAAQLGIHAEIGVRLNPNFTYTEDVGISAKFGVDEEQFYENLPRWKAMENITITGIHAHLHSQEMDAHLMAAYYGKMFKLAQRVQEALGAPLKFMNLGSGMGINFTERMQPFDTPYLGKEARRLMEQFRSALPQTKIYIETGRYAVGKSGTYCTKVLDKKVSRGKTYVLLANTLNGFMRPSTAVMMSKYMQDPTAPSWEPMFTGLDTVDILPLTDRGEKETVTLAGSLCTGTDLVAEDICLPRLERGDVVAMPNAGAYAAVVSPMQFASLVPPAQLFLTKDGQVVDATR